jgi:hypothetical protein
MDDLNILYVWMINQAMAGLQINCGMATVTLIRKAQTLSVHHSDLALRFLTGIASS